MKKYIIAIIAIGLAGFVMAQRPDMNDARSTSIIGDTQGTTNYVGIATVNITSAGVPSTNAASWRIIRTITDASGNILSVNSAFNTNYTDNFALTRNVWATRASTNTVYK